LLVYDLQKISKMTEWLSAYPKSSGYWRM